MLRFFRPHVLYYYIVREYLKNFSLAAVSCLLILMLALFGIRAAEMEDFGVSIGQVALLSPFFLPYALTYSIPLASMIAAILVFGRLSSENEILAAQAGGVSIGMLSVPILFCGVVFSFCALWCSDEGLDWGYRQIKYHITNLENPQLVEKLNKPGSGLPITLDGGGLVRINMLPHLQEADGGKLKPIHIVYFKGGRLDQNLYARHHTISNPYRPKDAEGLRMTVNLFDGQSLGEDPYFFKDLEIDLDLPSLASHLQQGSGNEGIFHNLREARRLRSSIKERRNFLVERGADLAAQIVAGSPGDPSAPLIAAVAWAETRKASDVSSSAKAKSLRKMVEFHRKLSLSFMPLSLIILGIGLGLLVQKSNRLLGFVLGLIAYFLIYYPLMIIFKELANESHVPDYAIWAPNILLLIFGWILWYAYEHGLLGGGLPAWVHRILDRFKSYWNPAWNFLLRINLPRLLGFRLHISRHVATVFLTPFLIIAMAVGLLSFMMDMINQGNEVLNGLLKADSPIGWLEARSFPHALLDVFIYYSIRGMAMLFDLLPAMILIAGVFAVTVMVRNNEHLILKAAGTRLQRVFRPILFLCLGLSLLVTAVRETIMPDLIMERDRLKPLIYHRSPKSRSMSGQTEDDQGRAVIYEIAQYSRNLHRCEGLRIYAPQSAKPGELVPRIMADGAVWDFDQEKWLLRSFNSKGSIKTLALDEKAMVTYDPHGIQIQSEPQRTELRGPGEFSDPVPGENSRNVTLADYSFPVTRASFIESWAGMLSPAYLESESLGPSVMRLRELWQFRSRPAYSSELWRRGSEWLTGILLLMTTIPILLSQEIRSPLTGIGKCILYGALYLGLNLAVAEAARQDLVVPWAPLIPHLAFLCLGTWRFVFRLET